MMSARPPKAPTGRPPPMTLPRVVRSGVTPKTLWAPPIATRNPVITSSKMSTLPWSSHTARSASRNPGSGSTIPIFPAIGSTITAATVSPSALKNALRVSSSLKGSVKVNAANAFGTPPESGSPRVNAPEPALTSKESA